MRGRGLGEVVVQVARRAGRVHVAVFTLQRRAVFKVHDERVEDLAARVDAQLCGQRRSGDFCRLHMHDSMVQVATRGDFVMHIAHRQGAGHAVQRGGKSAHALCAFHQSLGLQLAQRAAHGHAAHAKLRRQLGLTGHLHTGRPAALGQALHQVLFDASVGGKVGRNHGENVLA